LGGDWAQAAFKYVFARGETIIVLFRICRSFYLEFSVLRGHFDTKALAERSNVALIILILTTTYT
jgi:hypothetical protein